MFLGPTGMAADPVILPATASKHTHPVSKRRSDPFSDHSSIQASNTGDRSELESIDEKPERRILKSIYNTETEKLLDFNPAEHIDDMKTETSLMVLPAQNASYQLANFLRTTGTSTSEPEKSRRHKRSTTIPKSFKLFRSKDKDNPESSNSPKKLPKSKTLNDIPSSQANLPSSVEVKVSKSGVKYYQIAPAQIGDSAQSTASQLSADIIIDPRVSVLFEENIEEWNTLIVEDDSKPEDIKRDRTASGQTVRIITQNDEAPVRPAASPPPSPTHTHTYTHCHNQPSATRSSSSSRFTGASPNPLHSHPRSPITALPIIPPISPSLSRKHNRRLSAISPPRSVSHTISPNTSRRIILPHRRKSSHSSISPGPPPPRSPLRMSRPAGSIDGTIASSSSADNQISPVSPISPEDDTAGATSQEDSKLKSIPYASLPASLAREGQLQSSHSSGSSEAAIATGRRWVVQSKTFGREVPVVEVQSTSGNSPRQRRVLRRANRSETRGKDETKRDRSINKRMSVLQSWDDIDMVGRDLVPIEMHFPTNPIVRPLVGSVPTQSKLIPATKDKLASTISGRKSTIPTGNGTPKSPVTVPSRHPRPRSAKMPKRHSRQTPTTPRSSSPAKETGPADMTPSTPSRTMNLAHGKDISTVSPMTIDPSLPSPPPKRGLPPTPDKKSSSGTHARNHSSGSVSAASASVYSTTFSPKKKTKGPKPLNIEKVVGKFPSPPTSAQSPTHFQDLSPTKSTSTVEDHVSRQISLRAPTSKFSTATTGKARAEMLSNHSASNTTSAEQPVTTTATTPSTNNDSAALLAAMMARMDGIERHNRFLEAALMGMLRSGSLNTHDLSIQSGLGVSPLTSDHATDTDLASRPATRGKEADDAAEEAAFRKLTSIGHPAFAQPSRSSGWDRGPVATTPSPVQVSDPDILRVRQETSDELHGVVLGLSRQNSVASRGSGRSAGSAASARSALDTYMRARGMMDTSGIGFD
ncbi:Hypothetical protein D9617_19g101950 [Elsinoe fawcettii]|nr:Hypothetical protein D9617_19g101950 [Elsinoe fawcettii]